MTECTASLAMLLPVPKANPWIMLDMNPPPALCCGAGATELLAAGAAAGGGAFLAGAGYGVEKVNRGNGES